MTGDTPRWQYRFDAYRRVLARFTFAVEAQRSRELSELEKMGLIQAFKFTVELGWNLIGDVLRAQGVTLTSPSPNGIVRAAFEAGLVADGRGWLRAIRLRNELSHMYDERLFIAAVPEIERELFPLLAALPGELEGADLR